MSRVNSSILIRIKLLAEAFYAKSPLIAHNMLSIEHFRLNWI